MASENDPAVTAAPASGETAGSPQDNTSTEPTAAAASATNATPAADDASPGDEPKADTKPADVADAPLKSNGDASEASAAAQDGDAPITTTEAALKKKDSHKRRSSTVPENKGKKSKGGKAVKELQLDAKPGDYFWAYLKGHPAWPAVIADEEMLPEQIIAQRPVSTMRPDGTYREDFEAGGKNVRERTYPVMYLGTLEFNWMVNTLLKPLDPETISLESQGKKSKSLWKAYHEAKEAPPLQHWKDTLQNFQQEAEEAEAELAAQAEAKEKTKAEKAAKSSKAKRKSTGAGEDTEMADAPEDDAEAKPKASKKRKKTETSDGDDDEKPAKTPKTSVKLNLKTPNGTTDSASKTKSKAVSTSKKNGAKKEKAPEQTPEEAFEARKTSVLYLRHKLQKGFLTRDHVPKEDEMEHLVGFLKVLEETGHIEAPILRETRIAKVLKGILRLDSIPLDEKLSFKSRCTKLLEQMNKTLDENPETSGESSKKDDSKAHTPAAADSKLEEKPEAKAVEAAAAEATAEESEAGAGAAVEGKKDEPMPDADGPKPDVAKSDQDEAAAEKTETATAAAPADPPAPAVAS